MGIIQENEPALEFCMKMMNVVIEKAELTNEGGIFRAKLELKGASCGMAFSCVLDEYDNGSRHTTPRGAEFIRAILTTVGVDKWEDLEGKYVRALIKDNLCYGIGHITKDVFVDRSFFDEYEGITLHAKDSVNDAMEKIDNVVCDYPSSKGYFVNLAQRIMLEYYDAIDEMNDELGAFDPE